MTENGWFLFEVCVLFARIKEIMQEGFFIILTNSKCS